ncbi:helix-turn-helix domain-containing protein [Acinetobacter bereziniae]|uniref:helix-turn-helix domain-containing protein n=1 Tax=Acinetobacter bereziniae TaxID=106648 RepID=UPI002953C2C8|nr:helix-turn-helix domain-containing protein [Acinetobacter bereziniae]MDV8154560.1 helix-turn-helix domain-containing protein [Acinetobacter bereziniae]
MNQWQKMICDLKAQGLTQAKIATEIGCSQNYVSDLERGACGKRLSYDLGRNLEALWNQHKHTTNVA